MMNRFVLLGCCAALLGALGADAAAQQKRVPQFSDYPVKQLYSGKSATPVLETEGQRSAATYYQAFAEGGASFAGHYAVVMLTCGSQCTMVDFMDVRTGKIIAGKHSNSGWAQIHDAFRDVEFRRGSRLIAFAGTIDDKGPVGWHFYRFDAGKLKHLHTIVTDGDFRKPLADWMK